MIGFYMKQNNELNEMGKRNTVKAYPSPSTLVNKIHSNVPIYFNTFQKTVQQWNNANIVRNGLAKLTYHCTKKWSFAIKDLFSKCDQIRRKLRFGHINWRNP